MDNMTSNRPYLLRAFNDWILDNEMTPYIVVEADLPQVHVPPQTIKDGQVVLNISPTAVHMLEITNEQITFSARFGGVPFEVYIPMYAISAIYARENGAGTMFPPEEIDVEETEIDTSDIASTENASSSPFSVVESSGTSTVESTESSEGKDDDKTSHDGDKPKKGSHLSIVK